MLVLSGLIALGLGWYLTEGRSPGDPAGSDRLWGTYVELCETRSLATTSPEAARDLFFGQVHSPLHDIARAVEERDRTRAARFLEAKNDVELALNDGATGTRLAGSLDRLLTQTGEALRLLGVTTTVCNPS